MDVYIQRTKFFLLLKRLYFIPSVFLFFFSWLPQSEYTGKRIRLIQLHSPKKTSKMWKKLDIFRMMLTEPVLDVFSGLGDRSAAQFREKTKGVSFVLVLNRQILLVFISFVFDAKKLMTSVLFQYLTVKFCQFLLVLFLIHKN